jgi:hypothetical protein
VALSACPPEDRRRSPPFDDFLSKPALPRDVLRTVSRWLNSPRQEPAGSNR